MRFLLTLAVLLYALVTTADAATVIGPAFGNFTVAGQPTLRASQIGNNIEIRGSGGTTITTDRAGKRITIGGGGGGTWGSILGTLSAQTDLSNKFGTKADLDSPAFLNQVTAPVYLSSGAEHYLECTNAGAMTTSGLTTANAGRFCYDQSLAKFRYWNGSALADFTGSGGGSWGTITGTLSAQTDLWNQMQTYLLISSFNTYKATVQAKFSNMSSSFDLLRTAVRGHGIVVGDAAYVPPGGSIPTPTYSWGLMDSAADRVLLAGPGTATGFAGSVSSSSSNTSVLHSVDGISLVSPNFCQFQSAQIPTLFTGGHWSMQVTVKGGSPSTGTEIIGDGGGHFTLYLVQNETKFRIYVPTIDPYLEFPVSGANLHDGNSHTIRFVFTGTNLNTYIGTSETTLVLYDSSAVAPSAWSAFYNVLYLSAWVGPMRDFKLWNTAVLP